MIALMTSSLWAQDVTTTISEFLVKGPFLQTAPYKVDGVNALGKEQTDKSLLESFNAPAVKARAMSLGDVQRISGKNFLELGFSIDEKDFCKATIKVEGAKESLVLLDGEKVQGQLKLAPYTHQVTLLILSREKGLQVLSVKLVSDRKLNLRTDGKHRYDTHDVLEGLRVTSSSLDASGRYLLSSYRMTEKGGKTSSYMLLTQTQDGRQIARYEAGTSPRWMPRTSKMYLTRRVSGKTQLLTIDPANLKEEILLEDVPQGRLTFSPNEDYLIISQSTEGRKDDADVYEVIDPDDRQGGWRSRSNLSKLDLETGVLTPLTFGSHNARLSDISQDGKRLLISVSHSRLTKRPTTVEDILEMDLETMQVRTLYEKAEFLGSGQYSPDGKKILFTANAEAFGGIGMRVKEGQIPSLTDMRLYLVDPATKDVTPLNPDANFNVSSVEWSQRDNLIYAMAEDRDYVHLFTINPSTLEIKQVPTDEDAMSGFSMARNAALISYTGQGISNSTRLHLLSQDKKKNWKDAILDSPSDKILENVTLGQAQTWRFDNLRGDSIWAYYYLPPEFDPAKKYPMIVTYYGGCSPTERSLESRYPKHAYAAQGYVVLVIQPSGATGFGQEFAARHVNTWGKGTAEDIIEGTKAFCRTHSYVDDGAIGCIGASYGGFMTMYLLTQTDIFAAGVSHAGISDITSYWGEGYWGYSYSETASAGSYPWNNPEMYTLQSPLFNADKIHTPLLFTHGTSDHNVPIGESIQMFTALKLLGRETAFVQVRGQDHHILDYSMRMKWQDSIFAWFEKHLKKKDAWWESLYPATPLMN